MHGHISHTDNLKHNPIMRFINEQKPTYLATEISWLFHLLLFNNLGFASLPTIDILGGLGTNP